MAKRITNQLSYRAIRIEGGLIPADELTRLSLLADPKGSEQTEGQYRIARGLKLRDEIARDFKIALNLWQDFRVLRQRQDVHAHDVTVREWLLPLVRDVLHFHDAARWPTIEHAGHHYAIGHAGHGGQVPLVFAGFDQPIDAAADRFGELNPDTGKSRRRSPFMLAQEALNATDASLWAIVSNGMTLRILRDNASLTRPAYIEVDLEALFAEELLADFSAFWLLAHATRFVSASGNADAPPTDCPWERWRAAGQQAGVTVRGKLRYQVAEALRALGTGFLSHPANGALRAALQSSDSGYDRQAFFEELLRLVYRFIFLATVEDRRDRATGEHLVFAPDATAEAKARYLASYSLTWLRERAARRSQYDRHADLWQALTITFGALARGERALGLPALGGLFEAEQCPHLDAAQLDNRQLLSAVFQLGWFRADGGLTRVNYRDMGPEELGSVYESLLELVPDLQGLSHPASARLAFVGDDDTDASNKGNTRKLTGSYYTPDNLVQELIKSALEPVITQTVKSNPQSPVEALLSLTVCDPACGSGHFLLSAARRLADEVALHRAAAEREGGAPTPADYRHALRDVVSRCIYGVDKNPMAIQLAKTALWLEAYSPDRPLSFVDHHLRVGDALLGVLNPEVLKFGIPDEAYTTLLGDDKEIAAVLKKRNKADLKGWQSIIEGDLFTKPGLAAAAVNIESLDDDTLEHLATKRQAWADADATVRRSLLARIADTYVAAFLAPKVAARADAAPLSGYLWGLLSGNQIDLSIEEQTQALRSQHGVFHWWLAFPQVAARGGFSVMLGNPPWEQLQLSEEEFFASRAPSVAVLPGERRKQAIAALEVSVPWLWSAFNAAKRTYDATNLYFRASGRYPLTARGKLNTYALFAETYLQAVALDGRAGFIVPTGIATDESTKAFFERISVGGHLRSLHCLENEEFVFPFVHHAFRFALLTLSGRASSAPASLAFFARQPDQLHDPRRSFSLTPAEFALVNPNTRTCPVFRSERDAELTKKLYRAVPVLIKEEASSDDGQSTTAEVNPWGVRFAAALFNMTTDSGLFVDSPAPPGSPPRLRLYEAKLIHQFNHRWASYPETHNEREGRAIEAADLTPEQASDSHFVVRPRYWVDERQVLSRIARVPSRVSKAWLALHQCEATNSAEADLVFAETIASLAEWVASELFARCASAAETQDPVQRTAAKCTHQALRELSIRFPQLHDALQGLGLSTKRASIELPKWAGRNDDVRLTEDELLQLAKSLADVYVFQAVRGLLDEWMDQRSPRWLIGWRKITGVEKVRTAIAAVLPRSGVGDSMPLMSVRAEPSLCAAFYANWCALVFDYATRQKVGGVNLTLNYVTQLPVLPPERYTPELLSFILPRVLELTYTAYDLAPWARDLGYEGAPFQWDPQRRSVLRAELDALFAKLYGLNREELCYILDPADVMGADYPSETFRVLKEAEIRLYGEYRTRRLVLDAWDKLADGELLPALSRRQVNPYSPQAMIRNDEEGWLAGLVSALLTSAADGCTVDELQNLVARSGQAGDQLDESEARLLSSNVDSPHLVSARSLLDRIRPIVERLEGCSAVNRRVSGAASRFRRTDVALPADVAQTPGQAEIAGLLHLAENRRLVKAAGVEAPSESELPLNRGVG